MLFKILMIGIVINFFQISEVVADNTRETLGNIPPIPIVGVCKVVERENGYHADLQTGFQISQDTVITAANTDSSGSRAVLAFTMPPSHVIVLPRYPNKFSIMGSLRRSPRTKTVIGETPLFAIPNYQGKIVACSLKAPNPYPFIPDKQFPIEVDHENYRDLFPPSTDQDCEPSEILALHAIGISLTTLKDEIVIMPSMVSKDPGSRIPFGREKIGAPVIATYRDRHGEISNSFYGIVGPTSTASPFSNMKPYRLRDHGMNPQKCTHRPTATIRASAVFNPTRSFHNGRVFQSRQHVRADTLPRLARRLATRGR